MTIHLLLLMSLIGLAGCSRNIVLHPIDKQDIVVMKQGESYTPDRDGYFLSKYYLNKIAEAKVESK
jgi:hypothetical protein